MMIIFLTGIENTDNGKGAVSILFKTQKEILKAKVLNLQPSGNLEKTLSFNLGYTFTDS